MGTNCMSFACMFCRYPDRERSLDVLMLDEDRQTMIVYLWDHGERKIHT